MLLSKAYKRYIADYGSFHLRPRSMELYGQWINRTISIIGDKHINRITAEDMGELLEKLSATMGDNTIRVCFTALRSVFRFCRRQDIPCFNYEKVQIPRTTPSKQAYLSATEVARMLEASNSLENKLLIAVLFSSGMRISEALSLDRDQIENRSAIIIGKGNKMRMIYIDKGTEKILGEYLDSRTDDIAALFITRKGDRLTTNGAYSRVRTVRRRANINKQVHPHTFRHSCATDMLNNGADIYSVAEVLGHANINTTKRYLHIANRQLRKNYDKYHTDATKKPRKRSRSCGKGNAKKVIQSA